MMSDSEEGRIGSNINTNVNEIMPQDIHKQCLKNSITIECIKMNESKFHGVINYTEVKEKIFTKALGLPINILGSVRMAHHNYTSVKITPILQR